MICLSKKLFKIPEKQLHGSPERLKVDLIVERTLMLDVAEQGHPDDRVDEGDQRQQRSDVEERRKGHDERKQ